MSVANADEEPGRLEQGQENEEQRTQEERSQEEQAQEQEREQEEEEEEKEAGELFDSDDGVPQRFRDKTGNNQTHLELFARAYGTKKQHPLYRSTLSDIGAIKPTYHEMPTKYYPKAGNFTSAFPAKPSRETAGTRMNTQMDPKRPENQFDVAMF